MPSECSHPITFSAGDNWSYMYYPRATKISYYLYTVLVQEASSEWVLGIQIQQFENPLNALWRDGILCCCDNQVCEGNLGLTNFLTPCTAECDTYFKVHVTSTATEIHLPNLSTNAIEDGPSVIVWPIGFQMPLLRSNSTKQVSDYIVRAQIFKHLIVIPCLHAVHIKHVHLTYM